MGSLRSSLSQYRKRKQLSLDGTVGGIKPNRFRPGLGSAVPARRGMRTRGAASQGYMSPHPDAYEPHPGEAHLANDEYTPYQADGLNHAPDVLDLPTAFLSSDTGHPNADRRQLFRAFNRWLQMQPEFEVFPEPQREVIPFDHDPMLPRSSDPGSAVFVPRPSNEAIINDMVGELNGATEQREAKLVYENLPLIYELSGRAQGTPETPATGAGGVPGYSGFGDPGYTDELSPHPDLIPAQDPEHVLDPLGGPLADDGREAFLPDDLGLGAEIASKLGIAANGDSPTGGSDPLEYADGLSDQATLEQIVDELMPSLPEPDPMLEEQFYDDDDLLMNPWMMPGMGPMPPGF
jgi:hypothetical protein